MIATMSDAAMQEALGRGWMELRQFALMLNRSDQSLRIYVRKKRKEGFPQPFPWNGRMMFKRKEVFDWIARQPRQSRAEALTEMQRAVLDRGRKVAHERRRTKSKSLKAATETRPKPAVEQRGEPGKSK